MSNVVQLFPRTRAGSSPDGQRVVYTVKEVAQLLSLSLGSTYALVRDGTIPARRVGCRWVIPCQRFHEWLNAEPAEKTGTPTGTDRGRRRS